MTFSLQAYCIMNIKASRKNISLDLIVSAYNLKRRFFHSSVMIQSQMELNWEKRPPRSFVDPINIHIF